MSQPTEAAMNAARAIVEPHLWEDTARTIDRECLLPEKHTALLLAQALIDAMAGDDPADDDAVENLRTALAKIR